MLHVFNSALCFTHADCTTYSANGSFSFTMKSKWEMKKNKTNTPEVLIKIYSYSDISRLNFIMRQCHNMAAHFCRCLYYFPQTPSLHKFAVFLPA